MSYIPFIFILITLAWLAGVKLFLHRTVSYWEAVIQFGIVAIIILGVFAAGSHSQTSDVMFKNGVITELNADKRSCPWGWRDYRDNHCTEYRTRTVPGVKTCSTINGKQSCIQHYKTQYNYDYEWERRYFVRSTVGDFEVPRTDPRGVNTPPYFAELAIDDAVANQVSYVNYIKGAASTLHRQEVKDDDVAIAYPGVNRRLRANRFIATGVKFSSDEWKAWNEDLMVMNSELRDTKGNVIIVVTGYQQTFAEMLRRAWHAHNINDVVVVIGTDGTVVDWVDVSSWSGDSMVEVAIRDGILSNGTLHRQHINEVIFNAMSERFEIQSMDKFEYLADDIAPPNWVYVIAFIVLIIGNPVLSYIFYRNDII